MARPNARAIYDIEIQGAADEIGRVAGRPGGSAG